MGPPLSWPVAESQPAQNFCPKHSDAAHLPKKHSQGIVKLVHYALLERDDGVVRNVNLFGTNLRAALRDIAIAQAKLILEQARAVEPVQRMHFEAGHSNEESRAGELFLLVVLAKYVTNVLTQKTFDTLTKLLDPVHIQLRDFPFHPLTRLEGRDFAIDTIVPGNVGDKVFDARKRFHGKDGDGLILREIVHARFTGQARTAIDFRGARAALACFAVPANGEIGSEVPLNVMERIENDHAGCDRDAIVDRLPAARIATKNAQGSFLHDGSPFFDLSIVSSHRSGKFDPNTFHLVNFVCPMCGIIAFIACP